MSAGYHINLETGEPGPCKARAGKCPFGGEELHFTTEAGARQAYEIIAAAEKAKALQAWKKKAPRVPKAAPVNPSSGGHGRRGHGLSATPRKPTRKIITDPTPNPTPYYGGGHGGHGR